MRRFLSIIFMAVTGLMLSVSANAQMVEVKDLLAEGSFTSGMEGPAVDSKGNLYAVNFQKQGTVGIVTTSGEASIYVILPEGSIGNGIRFDRAGFMYIADYKKHNILKIDPRYRTLKIFAHNDKMNQPNDIAISPVTEFLYASDPNWSDSTGNLWMINRKGETFLLEGNIGTTNGVEVSPDGKRLYVNESIQRKIWVYDIKKDGFVKNKRLFFSFDDFGMDGMRCDSKGNLYVTRHGKGSVVMFSRSGKLLREIQLKGKLCSNIALGGDADNPTFYVTMADRGCFEYFRLK